MCKIHENWTWQYIPGPCGLGGRIKEMLGAHSPWAVISPPMLVRKNYKMSVTTRFTVVPGVTIKCYNCNNITILWCYDCLQSNNQDGSIADWLIKDGRLQTLKIFWEKGIWNYRWRDLPWNKYTSLLMRLRSKNFCEAAVSNVSCNM